MSTQGIEDVFERRKRRIADEYHEAESRLQRARQWQPLLAAEEERVNARLGMLGVAIKRRDLIRRQQEDVRTSLARIREEARLAAAARDEASKSVEAALSGLTAPAGSAPPTPTGAGIEQQLAAADHHLAEVGARHSEIRIARSLLKWTLTELEACEARVLAQGASLECELEQLDDWMREAEPAAAAEEAEVAALRARLAAIHKPAGSLAPLDEAVYREQARSHRDQQALEQDRAGALIGRWKD